MARLPVPGQDEGAWGDILNDFLLQAHTSSGSLKNDVVTGAAIQDGTISEALLDSAVQTKLNAVGSGGVTSVNTRTGAVTLTKTDVGLDNVDNTSDANKPVSTATQTALNGKANTSHTHTSTDISDSTATGRSVLTATDATAARAAIGAGTSNLSLGTTSSTAKAGDYTPTKTDVGLGNADNTSDANKPISTATQTALDAKADASDVGAKVLLIDDVPSLPPGTPAGVVVVVKS
jgi:hypothetical protein